jgi:hypothetical protein
MSVPSMALQTIMLHKKTAQTAMAHYSCVLWRCDMWSYDTVWLGPAGLGVRAAGFDSTLAIGGSLMPV